MSEIIGWDHVRRVCDDAVREGAVHFVTGPEPVVVSLAQAPKRGRRAKPAGDAIVEPAEDPATESDPLTEEVSA